jgi:hypothetical protein
VVSWGRVLFKLDGNKQRQLVINEGKAKDRLNIYNPTAVAFNQTAH